MYIYMYIYVYLGSISSLMQISLNIILLIINVLLLSYSGGIDLGIVHSCVFCNRFSPDDGPRSGRKY